MRISDWSSDVCSSDLSLSLTQARPDELEKILRRVTAINDRNTLRDCLIPLLVPERFLAGPSVNGDDLTLRPLSNLLFVLLRQHQRSEEHTSELQSLMRISYAVFCLKKKTYTENNTNLQIQKTHEHK